MSIRRPEAPALQQQPSAPVGVVGAVRATGAVRHAQYTASGVQASRMPGTCLTTDVVMPRSKKPETATHANVTRIFEAQYNPETIAAFASADELVHFALGDAKLHASHKATIGACAVTSKRAAECCVEKARNKCEHMDEAQTQGLSDHINRILERDEDPAQTEGSVFNALKDKAKTLARTANGRDYSLMKKEVLDLIEKQKKDITKLEEKVAVLGVQKASETAIKTAKATVDRQELLLYMLEEGVFKKIEEHKQKSKEHTGKFEDPESANRIRQMLDDWKAMKAAKDENIKAKINAFELSGEEGAKKTPNEALAKWLKTLPPYMSSKDKAKASVKRQGDQKTSDGGDGHVEWKERKPAPGGAQGDEYAQEAASGKGEGGA